MVVLPLIEAGAGVGLTRPRTRLSISDAGKMFVNIKKENIYVFTIINRSLSSQQKCFIAMRWFNTRVNDFLSSPA